MKHCTKTVYFVTNVYACCIPACSRALVKCVFTCVLRVFNMGMFLAKEVCTVMLLLSELHFIRTIFPFFKKLIREKCYTSRRGGGVAGGSDRGVSWDRDLNSRFSAQKNPPLCPIIPATPRVEYFYPPFSPFFTASP